MPLSDEIIDNTKPCDRPIRLFDGEGLYLENSPAGGKWWRLKYRFAGKEKRVSLGTYPVITLTEARTRKNDYRNLLAAGIDPSEYIKMEKARRCAEKERETSATRFFLDNDGALSLSLGNRRFILTPTETTELRVFLDATRAVISKVKICR